MKNRCYLQTNTEFPRYGGRGIKVCDRWLGNHGFENFYADMGDRPKGMSLDRIDNNGDYCPENCRWATRTQQANNTSTNVFIEHNGERHTVSEWCRLLGIKNVDRTWQRVRKGWPFEVAFCDKNFKFRQNKKYQTNI